MNDLVDTHASSLSSRFEYKLRSSGDYACDSRAGGAYVGESRAGELRSCEASVGDLRASDFRAGEYKDDCTVVASCNSLANSYDLQFAKDAEPTGRHAALSGVSHFSEYSDVNSFAALSGVSHRTASSEVSRPSASIAIFGKNYKYFSPELLPSNVIVGSSASDGVGLSTSLSMIAQNLASYGYSVALVDADVSHGGLDVLLGLESDDGRRLQEVEAPLGRLDGSVLKDELIYCNGVGVLAYAPWRMCVSEISKADLSTNKDDVIQDELRNSSLLKPWLLDASIRGLAQCNDVVIVDVGSGISSFNVFNTIMGLAFSPIIYASELSVLGMARMRAYNYQISIVKEYLLNCLYRYSSQQSDDSFNNIDFINENSITVGIMPHGLAPKLCAVDIDEASQYLSKSVIGPIKYDSRLHEDIIEGYGIRKIPKSSRFIIDQLSNWVLEVCNINANK